MPSPAQILHYGGGLFVLKKLLLFIYRPAGCMAFLMRDYDIRIVLDSIPENELELHQSVIYTFTVNGSLS